VSVWSLFLITTTFNHVDIVLSLCFQVLSSFIFILYIYDFVFLCVSAIACVAVNVIGCVFVVILMHQTISVSLMIANQFSMSFNVSAMMTHLFDTCLVIDHAWNKYDLLGVPRAAAAYSCTEQHVAARSKDFAFGNIATRNVCSCNMHLHCDSLHAFFPTMNIASIVDQRHDHDGTCNCIITTQQLLQHDMYNIIQHWLICTTSQQEDIFNSTFGFMPVMLHCCWWPRPQLNLSTCMLYIEQLHTDHDHCVLRCINQLNVLVALSLVVAVYPSTEQNAALRLATYTTGRVPTCATMTCRRLCSATWWTCCCCQHTQLLQSDACAHLHFYSALNCHKQWQETVFDECFVRVATNWCWCSCCRMQHAEHFHSFSLDHESSVTHLCWCWRAFSNAFSTYRTALVTHWWSRCFYQHLKSHATHSTSSTCNDLMLRSTVTRTVGALVMFVLSLIDTRQTWHAHRKSCFSNVSFDCLLVTHWWCRYITIECVIRSMILTLIWSCTDGATACVIILSHIQHAQDLPLAPTLLSPVLLVIREWFLHDLSALVMYD
jgi:hypothetical protein